jgi:hypothetical protein
MARMARLSTLALALLAGTTRVAGQGVARGAVASAVRAALPCALRVAAAQAA